MKTFLDRFRRKGKGDEPSEGGPDLFGNAHSAAAQGKPGSLPGNGPAAEAKPPGIELTPVPVAPVRASDTEVRLELGDFLHRIPQNLLRPGPHDVSAELLFSIHELSSLIANGQTSINLTEIQRRMPGIFRNEVKAEDKVEIRFPWQKLMHLVKSPGETGTGIVGITSAAAEALAHKIRSRRPARNIMPSAGGAMGKGEAAAPTPTPTPAFREAPASAALPATAGSQQLSWFSKPPGELPQVVPPAPAAPPAAENSAGFNRDDLVRARDAAMLKLSETKAEFDRQSEALAAERDTIAAERDHAIAELERAKADVAIKGGNVEKDEQRGAKKGRETADADAKREALEKEIASKNSQIAILGEEIAALKESGGESQEAASQEHDALVAELAQARKELKAKSREIELQQGLGTRSASDAARLADERQALQKQVAEQASTLEAIKAELDGLRQGAGKKYAAIAEERDKVLSDLQQARKELADKIDQIEFQQSLSSKSAEDAAKLAAERESLQKELATKGADLDAITAELGLIKKDGDEKFASVSAERDRVSADLDQARKELTEKRGQVEFQQGLSARSAEESARLAAERESLQGEVTAKSAELETLKSELHEFRTGSGKQFEAVAGERDNIRAELAGAQQELAAKSAQLGALASELESHKKGGEKLSAVAQERDALHKQKTMLAAQLEQATANLAAKQKAVVEVDLSRKENQRHLEELQRRISGFESGQRATSQELTRERETRIKAERSLAAAERTRQEATAMIESMRSETKRESDATTRKRDADVARAQKELQERIETLTEAHRKALAERDERVQEIEKLRAESAAAIETTKSATAAEAAQWEKRAVAGLEDDIAKYRDRIKALLLERDTAAEAAKAQVETLSRERDVVAEKLAHAISEHDKSAAEHKDAFERLQGKGSTIEQGKEAALHQLEQARMAFAERTEQLTAAQAAAENAKGIVAELREQITKLSGERDSVQADWEKLFAELEEARSQTKRQSEEFASLRIDLEQAGGKELSELRVHAGDLQQALDAVSGERDELHKKLESAQADIKRTESEHASLLATHQSASVDFARNLQEHEKTVAGLRSEIGELRSALDERLLKEHELQKQIEESSAQLDHAASEHARQIADIRAEHDEQFATHQATSSNLAKAEAEHEKIVADLKREIEQSKHTLDAFAGERGTLQNDLAAAMSLLDQARAEHDTQVSALRQEHTDALSKREENEIKLSASLEEQEGCVAGLRREIDDLRGALDARTQVEQDLQRKVREASEQLAGAESERAAQISKLQAEHERDLTSQQTKAGDLANAVAEREETITRLSTEIDESKGSLGALAGEREKIQKDLDAAMSLLDQTRSEHDANVSKLDAEHAGALSKHDEQVAALTTALKEHEQTASGLRGEIDTLKKSVAAGTGERGQIQKKLEAARAEIKKAKAENDKQLASINAEHAALAEAHRETTSELAALALAHRNAVDGLQDDMQQRIAVATADGEKTKGEYEAKLAETRGKHSTLLAEHVRVSEEFTRTIRGHEGTLAALREELSTARTEGSRELAESKSAHELEKAQFAKEERAFNETKKKLENKLADAERATAEIAVRAQALDTTVRARESAIAERDAEVVRSKKDGESALAALSREHAAGLDSMTAEKDRQLAALTVDRAKTVAALTRERDELLTKLEGVEETLTARIAALTDERNESIRESTTLAQRLASIAVESDRKIEELERTHAEANDERRALAAELETAKEAHKAQSGVFAREFKGVVKQRDDVAGALEAARTEIQEKATALAREKANLERVESDVAARFEREATRMRRERDVLIRQRDELHSRITKMVEEQRELLEELNSQSVRHTPTPNDIIQPSRAAKQTNVIEITAAQIVPDVESDRGINLPRIRPVLIPPPNVRIL